MSNSTNQNRRWDYKDDDKTLWLNYSNAPYRPAGLYNGFDIDQSLTTGTTLRLIHTRGWERVDVGSSTSSKVGVWITKQGISIEQNENVELTINANSSGNPRIDIIIGSHQYVETVGGAAASYSIVQGTPSATPVAPVVPNSKTDVILGYMEVPDGAANINNITYHKAITPKFGDDDSVVKTNVDNNFTESNTFNSLTVNILEGDIDRANSKIVLNNSSEEINKTGVGINYNLSYQDSEEFVLINTIEVSGTPVEGHTLRLKTPVELYFLCGFPTGNIVNEKGTNYTIVPVNNYVDLIYHNSEWVITPRMPQGHKLENILMLKDISVTLSSNRIGDTNSIGNYFKVSNSGNDTLKYVIANDLLSNTYIDNTGTLLVIEFTNTNSVVNLTHQSSNVPTGYLSMWLPNEEDMSVNTNQTLMFIRSNDYWKLVGYYPINETIDTWNNATINSTNGFSNKTNNGLQYRLENNLLRLRGIVELDSSAYFENITGAMAQAELATITISGSKDMVIPVLLYGDSYPSTTFDPIDAELHISSAGSVSIKAWGGFSNTRKVYFDSLSFDIS